MPIVRLVSCFLLQLVCITQVAIASPDYHAVELFVPGAPDGFTSIHYLSDVDTSGQVGGYGGGEITNNQTHAILASPQFPQGIDLHPQGRFSSWINQCSNGYQTGYARLGSAHATVWHGTPESALDLHPNGYLNSSAEYATATEQVGHARAPDSTLHAMLWHGSAASAVDLHPAGFAYSHARATDGVHQVGNGTMPGSGAPDHALLWSGSAASVVDLHPAGFFSSIVLGVGGGQQVGSGGSEALLWFGTAESVVNLSAGSFPSGQALATNGSMQVGQAAVDSGGNHAVAWFGSAESRLDLFELLPPGFSSSVATSIDADGTIYGRATDLNGTPHVIAWVVPEPSAATGLCMIVVGMMAFARRRGNSRVQPQSIIHRVTCDRSACYNRRYG